MQHIVTHSIVLRQGCTTYFTDSARNISGSEVGPAVGVCAASGVQGQSPWSGDEVPLELMTIY